MPALIRVMLVTMAVLAIAAAFWARRSNREAQAWPSVEGVIATAVLEPDPHDAGSSVRITYTYKVQGRAFTSSRISYAGMRDDRSAKDALLARFPQGALVEVYHDPRDPQRAVLVRDPSNAWFWLGAVGALFGAIGVLTP